MSTLVTAFLVLVAIIASIFFCWQAFKLFCKFLFTTYAGVVVWVVWGTLWGYAGFEHMGYTSWSPIEWHHIWIPGHMLGWLCGLGALFFPVYLVKEDPGNPAIWGIATAFTLLMLPAIIIAWSLYFGFIFGVIICMAALFMGRGRS